MIEKSRIEELMKKEKIVYLHTYKGYFKGIIKDVSSHSLIIKLEDSEQEVIVALAALVSATRGVY